MTVQEIINKIIAQTGLERIPEEKTCDKLMAGRLDMDVKKIATTFMATVDVIQEAIEAGVNLIITHEPTWYTGVDDTGWVEDDPVYIKKRKLIDDNAIAIWRFHDHMHLADEDGIYRGFDKEFGWESYKIPMPKESQEFIDHFGASYDIPETTLAELASFFKKKLDMPIIQIVGNPDMKVKRVSSLVGGGSLGLGEESLPMRHMKKYDIDVAICGDITEWTLSAYVRDAFQLGLNKGMLVLGHERSEEPGMKHLVEWMKSFITDIDIIFIDAKEPFGYL